MYMVFTTLNDLQTEFKKLYDERRITYYKMYIDKSGSFWKEGEGNDCQDEIVYDFVLKD